MGPGELVVEPEQVDGAVERMNEETAQHHGDWMQPELERGDDPEIPAAPAQAPEEVAILLLARGDEPAIRGHQIDRDEVVAGEAVAAHQPAKPAAQRQARHPRARDDTTRRREAKSVGLVVEFTPENPGFGSRHAGGGIDTDALHRRKVDHQPATADGVAGDIVSTATHGQHKTGLAGEGDSPANISEACAAGDQGRAMVDHPIVYRANIIVARVGGTEQHAAQTGFECPDGSGVVSCCSHIVLWSSPDFKDANRIHSAARSWGRSQALAKSNISGAG